MENKNKEKYTAKEIKNAPKAGGQELDNAQFPCYSVKVTYHDGRVVEEVYPDGMEKRRLPWESHEDYNEVQPPVDA